MESLYHPLIDWCHQYLYPSYGGFDSSHSLWTGHKAVIYYLNARLAIRRAFLVYLFFLKKAALSITLLETNRKMADDKDKRRKRSASCTEDIKSIEFNLRPHDSQDSSLFFRKLPPEIRLEIYSQVFYSTRLSFDGGLTTPVAFSDTSMPWRVTYAYFDLRPAPNSLALLRVCRKVNGEIGDSWIDQVLFSFGDTKMMLEKLGALQPSTLAKLRHMRITGGREPKLEIKQNHQVSKHHAWAEMFKLLPGLCLDRLTVLGHHAPGAIVNLASLDQLIKHSDGWKELYFVSHCSAILELHTTLWCFWRSDVDSAPRLSVLDPEIVMRDGPTASISIYRSIHVAENGRMITEPATREAISCRPARPIADAERDPARNPLELKKEVLVIARRGRGVDCTVKPLPSDIQDVKVLPRRKVYDIHHDGFIVDSYKHVDDYEWTPLHLDESLY